ncbi:septal ring lytic transglycosylase RlpA family protein [Bartonella krasnovii]|uniref:Endolytic peptidoglycan transglycosylase RlpA n=1 Tax=Bartonella krasnovii TaxID=2267275 RepID=A0A5B9D1B3_9HYPH|nr:septal ring lytic transglycosylase RlpA family protein [Bartonella krasnovii]QEE12217.1 septal ring lytic transglycosylase RlpA family protein [Bartonella krasnovii]UNF41322.1 septal ring lytic transglycosylase RlpA family protein [Bartonella krasnovii]UNF43069.1 septal ring lytic transglycosylase RlpA family protein [Bartonella krasnovii]UNF54529.1 septal ring lytic transglycosylase RlpA family protein [Bartonella krasnovii]UNF56279.1 septal ring lytic transglycosylase RlpA family protein 
MPSNSKKKFTFIIKPTFQLFSMIVISQSLMSCCSSETAHFSIKDFYHNKPIDVNTSVLSKQISNNKNQSEAKKRGRATVGKPYQIKGKWYYPEHDPTYARVGEASWYGSDFHGRLTANGEIYDMNLLTAAHPTMPLPSYARVTNLKNGSSLIVRVNDRGPFMKDRIIDLSKQAATILGYVDRGVADVKVEYIAEAPIGYYDGAYLMASYTPGNANSYSLASEKVLKKRETVLFKERNIENKEELAKASSISQEKYNKTVTVKLPEIGPIMVNKPVPFDQVASINKLNKRTKLNWLQLF